MKAYALSPDGTLPPAKKPSLWRRFVDRHLPALVIYLMVVTLVAVVLFPYLAVTVPSGQVGVLWKRFGGGTVLDPRQLRDEGLRFILPWNGTVHLRPASAIHYAELQCDLQRWREPGRDDERPLPVAARRHPRAAPGDRAHRSTCWCVPVSEAWRARSWRNTPPSRSIRPRARKFRIRSAAWRRTRLSEKMMEREGEDERYRVSMRDTVVSTPWSTASSCPRTWSAPSIARPSSITYPRNTSSASSASGLERKKIEAQGIHEFQTIVSQGISVPT